MLYKLHHVYSSQYRSDTRTVNMSRCKLSLGSDRYIEVKEWKGELRVDLREWKDDKPMKKGISLTLMRWKNLVEHLEYADQARAEKRSKFREFMSPAKIFLRNKESSENVKFIRGVTLTRYILSTYVDINNA